MSEITNDEMKKTEAPVLVFGDKKEAGAETPEND